MRVIPADLNVLSPGQHHLQGFFQRFRRVYSNEFGTAMSRELLEVFQKLVQTDAFFMYDAT